jgi:hypothetical protein
MLAKLSLACDSRFSAGFSFGDPAFHLERWKLLSEKIITLKVVSRYINVEK